MNTETGHHHFYEAKRIQVFIELGERETFRAKELRQVIQEDYLTQRLQTNSRTLVSQKVYAAAMYGKFSSSHLEYFLLRMKESVETVPSESKIYRMAVEHLLDWLPWIKQEDRKYESLNLGGITDSRVSNLKESIQEYIHFRQITHSDTAYQRALVSMRINQLLNPEEESINYFEAPNALQSEAHVLKIMRIISNQMSKYEIYNTNKVEKGSLLSLNAVAIDHLSFGDRIPALLFFFKLRSLSQDSQDILIAIPSYFVLESAVKQLVNELRLPDDFGEYSDMLDFFAEGLKEKFITFLNALGESDPEKTRFWRLFENAGKNDVQVF